MMFPMPLTTEELSDYRDRGFVRVADFASQSKLAWDRRAALRARVDEHLGARL